MQWGEPRPRHMRDPKTRAPEDSLQVGDTPTHAVQLALVCVHQKRLLFVVLLENKQASEQRSTGALDW